MMVVVMVRLQVNPADTLELLADQPSWGECPWLPWAFCLHFQTLSSEWD